MKLASGVEVIIKEKTGFYDSAFKKPATFRNRGNRGNKPANYPCLISIISLNFPSYKMCLRCFFHPFSFYWHVQQTRTNREKKRFKRAKRHIQRRIFINQIEYGTTIKWLVEKNKNQKNIFIHVCGCLCVVFCFFFRFSVKQWSNSRAVNLEMIIAGFCEP